MVTHDPSLAARAKRQIYIKDGHVSELTNKNSNLHVVGEA
jgi:putative ABC transport system ATP-binding protein